MKPPTFKPASDKPKKAALSGEEDFLAEMTRKHLAEWADRQVRQVAPPVPDDQPALGPYIDFAVQKGWTAAKGGRVTAAGFKVAAAFLRR